MFKKLLFTTFLILSTNLYLSAQNFDLKNYSDHRQGFRGVASAIFAENIAEYITEISEDELEELMLEYFNEIFGSEGRPVNRITRNNQWLARQALDEWDLDDYDIFFIIIAENRFSDSALLLITLIEDGGNSFKWWGRMISDF